MGYVKQRTSHRMYLLVFILAFVFSLFSVVYVHYYTLVVPLKQGSPSFVIKQDVDASHSCTSAASSASIMHSIANKKESFQLNTDDLSYSGKSIPLMDFKDLQKRKKRLLLLVTVGSAPQRFDRRQAIRDTWWKFCYEKKVRHS